MKKVIFILLIPLFTTCSIKVNTFFDPRVDFSQYDSWCWLKGCDYRIEGLEYINQPEIIDFLAESIEEEFNEKGLTKDDNDPDFMVDFHIVMTEVETYFNQPFDHTDEFEYFPDPRQLKYTFLKGSMVIDIVDHNESKMIWRSDVSRYLDLQQVITKEEIKKAVKKAFKNFPPPYKP